MRTASVAVLVLAGAMAAPAPASWAGGGPAKPAPAGKPTASGTISGIVTDEEGKPLAGASVQVRREGVKQPILATSDAKGFYAVRGLASGKATVVIRAKGRIPVRQEVDVPATGLAIADARLHPGVRFAGKVVDMKGAGVGDVRILAFQSGEGGGLEGFFSVSRGDSTRSAADGAYELDGIAPGRSYTLRFVHPRYQTVDLPGLDAAPGGGHDALEATLEDAAWVTGTVVGTDGKPVAGADVSAGEDPFSVGADLPWMRLLMSLLDEDATPPTDAKGHFSVGSLAEDKVSIAVRAPGYFPATVEVTGLEMGKEKGGVVVTLEAATAAIEGSVVDDLGQPVANAHVVAWRDGDGVSNALSDARGRFRLARVASKEPVSLTAAAPGHTMGRAEGVALDAKDAKVTVRRLGRLTLRATGPDGKPLARVHVRTLVAGDDDAGQSGWMEQGKEPLVIDLPLATVEVVVEAEGCAAKTVGTYEPEPGQAFDGGTVTLEKAPPPDAPAMSEDG